MNLLDEGIEPYLRISRGAIYDHLLNIPVVLIHYRCSDAGSQPSQECKAHPPFG